MMLTTREVWTAVHGLLLGGGFLLAFTGTAVGLWGLRPQWTTPAGRAGARRWVAVGATAMAGLAWATVLLGTFVLYPWYRTAPPPAAPTSAMSLSAYPKAALLASPGTAGWHTFGMEWKEHVGWLAAILATPVAVVAVGHRRTVVTSAAVRQAMLALLTAAFLAAVVAGAFGAFINKMAPLR
jgi:hypothetical protein